MPAWEAVQLTLGLLVPPLLVWHVVGTRLSHELAGTQDTYTLVVLNIWQLDRWRAFGRPSSSWSPGSTAAPGCTSG